MDTLTSLFDGGAALLLLFLVLLGPGLAAVHHLLRDVYRSEPWRAHPMGHWDA